MDLAIFLMVIVAGISARDIPMPDNIDFGDDNPVDLGVFSLPTAEERASAIQAFASGLLYDEAPRALHKEAEAKSDDVTTPNRRAMMTLVGRAMRRGK
jgi:hypothetical protein